APAYFKQHGKPKTPSDLKTLDHVRFLFGGNVNVWEFKKDGRTERIMPQARYSVTSSLAVRDALRGGFGVGLIPLSYVSEDLQNGPLQSAPDQWTTTEISHSAVYPSRQHLAPKPRVFLAFLVQQFNRAPSALD